MRNISDLPFARSVADNLTPGKQIYVTGKFARFVQHQNESGVSRIRHFYRAGQDYKEVDVATSSSIYELVVVVVPDGAKLLQLLYFFRTELF